jgi:triacylglycerol lipase
VTGRVVERMTPPESWPWHVGHSNSFLPVVLVPGFRDDVRKVSYLARRLQSVGFSTHAISPQPSTGEMEIQDLAQQLAASIQEELVPEGSFHLFGFSMGGLICRYYVQRLGGADRVAKLVTVATPNRGSWLVRLYPDLPACRQMLPGSDFLLMLNRDLAPLEQVDYTSLWSRLDMTIVPAYSSWLPVGRHLTVSFPIHGWLLRDAHVVGRVVDQFLCAEAARSQAQAE